MTNILVINLIVTRHYTIQSARIHCCFPITRKRILMMWQVNVFKKQFKVTLNVWPIFYCRLLRNAMSSSLYRNGDNAIPGPNRHCSINRAIGSGLCSFRSFQQGKRAEIQSFFGKNGLRVRMELSHFIAEWKYQVSTYRFIRLMCSFIYFYRQLTSFTKELQKLW